MVVFGLSVCGPVAAADPKLLKQANQAVARCIEAMPDTRLLAKKLKEDGYEYESFEGGYNYYSYANQRIIVGTSMTRSKRHACFVAVHKMTVEEATALAQPWVKAGKAKPFKHPSRRFKPAWLGNFKGSPVVIAVRGNLQVDWLYGSAIVASEYR